MRTGSRWRHVKRGTTYVVRGRAALKIGPETIHSVGMCTILEKMSFVAYVSEDDDTLWVRPESEFLDGRFVEIQP